MIMKINTALLLWMTALFWASAAHADLTIRITDGVDSGTPILIAPFQGSNADRIIEADLRRSGRFTVLNASRGQGLVMGQPMNPQRVQATGAEYIVVGRRAGGLEMEIVNATTGQRMAGFRIPAHRNERRMAHKAADAIFERLTGIKGAFDTRIAYVSASGPPKRQTYRLIISDADGHNPRTVLSSKQPIMSPTWSPDARRLAYVSFESGRSSVYVQDLASGRKTAVSTRKGLNGAPAWSPDGRRLALSLAGERGNADIYVMNAGGGGLRQITRSRAIDTEPAWANNSTLVYTSDQGGRPQLYRTSVSGGDGRRITFSGNYNAAPSIHGNKIAMVRRNGGAFRIAVMNASSRQATTLSRGNLDESPSFAPNGTMILYATHSGGRGVLAVASDNGKARQTLSSAAGDVRDPAWSPYLN